MTQPKTNRNLLFLKIAVKNKLLDSEQAEQVLTAIEDRQALGVEKTAGEIALEKKLLTPEAVKSIDAALRASLPPEKVAGFKVLEVIGRGAAGVVYKAVQLSLDKVVALKILHDSLTSDPKYVEMFVREAKAAGRLNHPHVVHAIDAGYADDHYYFAMEYVDGETLRDRLKRESALSEETVLGLTRALAQGLSNAHQQGLLHRDLKPDNILLGKDGQIKLADLGLALPLDHADVLQQEHRRTGTPYYMSPEQAQGKKIDERSDLYALGATIYHSLAGKPPFSGKTVKEILTKHVHQPAVALRDLGVQVSAATEKLVLNLLEKDPEHRCQTAAELIERVKEAEGQRAAAPARGTPARPAPRRAAGSAPRRKRPLGIEEERQPTGKTLTFKSRNTYTKAGAALGGLLGLILVGAAYSKNPTADERNAQRMTAFEEQKSEKAKEIIELRKKQWAAVIQEKEEGIQKQFENLVKTARTEERLREALWNMLKLNPDTTVAPQVLAKLDQLVDKQKKEKTATVDAYLARAQALEDEGKLWKAVEALYDIPDRIRNESGKGPEVAARITELEGEIDRRWENDRTEAKRLRDQKEFRRAMEILGSVPDYADEEIAEAARTLKGEYEEAMEAFAKVESEKRLNEETRRYAEFVSEYRAACRDRRFADCMSKALTLQAEMSTDKVRHYLETDLEAFQMMFSFMNDARKYLEKNIGTDTEIAIEMKDKRKEKGTVHRVEDEQLWLTIERGGGTAAVPLKFAEMTDQTVFDLVAELHGPTSPSYLIPLGVLFTYRGQLDIAQQHFDQARRTGISPDTWLEKLEWMRKNSGS